MNWSKTILAGVVAGVVAWLADFVLHGLIMGSTYAAHSDVFSQDAASPVKFLVVELSVWITVAILFAKTRGSWAAGWKGGANFGFWLAIATFFVNHFHPLTIAGFPYFLAWCWGGIGLIVGVLGGAALGAVDKG